MIFMDIQGRKASLSMDVVTQTVIKENRSALVRTREMFD